MAVWEIAVTVLAVLAILWTLAIAAVGIPLLFRLKGAADRMDNLLRDAELHVGPALVDVREMVGHLNKVSAGVAEGVRRFGPTFEAVGELGRTLRGANAVLRAALGPGLTLVGGLIAGVKAGGGVLLRRFVRRR